MGLVFQGLYAVSISLTVIYTIVAIASCRQLIWLQHYTSHGLNTKKLFVMTCLLTSILRIMSFGSMIVFDFINVTYDNDSSASSSSTTTMSSSSSSSTKEFFEKSLIVLFDLPDFCCISAYVLLIVVWAESYLRSRRHWLSSLRFRKLWMLSYFFFNIVLYTVQVTLYSLLFVPKINRLIETNMIYITLAFFNLGLPLCFTFGYLYLAIQFSGFPFSTIESKLRLRSLSRLGLIWTCARLCWGLVALTSVVQGWLIRAQRSQTFYTIVLISIFMIVEVLPILLSIQSRSLSSLSEQDIAFHNKQSEDINYHRTQLASAAISDPLLMNGAQYTVLGEGHPHERHQYRYKDSIDEDDYELENEYRPAHADKHLESDEYFHRYKYLREQQTGRVSSTGLANRQLAHASTEKDIRSLLDGDSNHHSKRQQQQQQQQEEGNDEVTAISYHTAHTHQSDSRSLPAIEEGNGSQASSDSHVGSILSSWW